MPAAASADDDQGYAWTVVSPEQEQVLEAATSTDVNVGDTVPVTPPEFIALAEQFGW